MKNPLPLVQATIKAQTNRGYVPSIFAADQGVISQSLFRVSIAAVQKFLREHNPPITPECGEAHNHNNGTPYIEHIIRQIKELIRFAILYLLRNPNFASFHFTRRQCLRLWGELFYWAIAIINLKPSYSQPTITRYEHFLNIKPDLRTIRLLPIFSSLYVLRRAEHAELHSQHDFWQLGLYVGPSPSVPGAILAAVHVNNDDVHIITTSAIKGVSDGGQVSVYPTADTSINCLYEKDNAIHDPLAVAQIPDPAAPPPSRRTPRPTTPAVQLVVPQSSSPAAVPLQEPTATAALPTVDPVTATIPSDPVLLPSEPVSVEHQSTLPPTQNPSLQDSRINGKVNSAQDPVPSESSPHLQPQPLSTPLLQRGSRRKPVRSSPSPAPPALSATPSTNHTYNTRKKTTSLPVALHTTFQPLTTAADLFAFSASLIVQPHQSHYVDWTNLVQDTDINNEEYNFSFKQNAYLVFDSSDQIPNDRSDSSSAAHSPTTTHEGFRAIKVNVPKTFAKALIDPEWGEPARSELNTIVEENSAIVRIDSELARQHISDGAEVLYMHPVYEEKLKEGKVVRKVRLVINGRNHTKHGNTYSPTPSREEFLILLHIIATLDFDYWHLDEKRAFLTA